MELPEPTWVPFTAKSAGIPFEGNKNGEGDGEQMVAAEYGTVVLGQNSPYDIIVEGNPHDVKKLDVKDDFNTGKKGRDAYREPMILAATLINTAHALAENDVFTKEEKELLSDVGGLSPDELVESNQKKLVKACRVLQTKREELRSTLPVGRVTINGQAVEIPLGKYYSICQMADLPFPPKYSPYVERIQLLQKMDHVYIDEPDKFMKDLNSLVEKIFSHMGLIIVHKEKGYMRLKDASKIRFLRITRGCPRFQVIF